MIRYGPRPSRPGDPGTCCKVTGPRNASREIPSQAAVPSDTTDHFAPSNRHSLAQMGTWLLHVGTSPELT